MNIKKHDIVKLKKIPHLCLTPFAFVCMSQIRTSFTIFQNYVIQIETELINCNITTIKEVVSNKDNVCKDCLVIMTCLKEPKDVLNCYINSIK